MKFSVAITNPPYSNSLHLQIMEEVVKVCDTVVNVSPVRWLEDPLARYKKKSDYNKFEASVSKKIERNKKLLDGLKTMVIIIQMKLEKNSEKT